MIWFSCSKCGKSLARPEGSAGAFVFCTCGQGLVVPWESTIEPPAADAPPEELPAQPPPLVPVPVPEESIPVAQPAKPPPYVDLDVRRREQSPRERDKCFNHQERLLLEKCADCGEGFCGDCLVKLQGQVLCGPCKNLRLRRTSQGPSLSSKALIGLLVSLCFAPAPVCMWPIGNASVAVLGGAVALMGQLLALALAGLALRDTESNPKVSGRALAITTLLMGGISGVITISFMIFGPH